ncbi:SDR family NAD(P)-dependent oxidoreductase [Saccharicrinis fermentans]|uniref:3-oxoacyl-[acyl-carrier-protein] reductase FabG n=1 Tax=Saccharicrinis fermentans DSM 9555 = JCM 21142 TaxID=869213 RepID=W7YLU6_9BACT|nr:SDR family NAD(P)-dependent oxidoreductase [Saccharicrinis fermentans]GAF03354.1 3-oxoacyl-[acyl-carrier-protein] reductase FabG [Saccharicrinis fermentans DSM 9555 = JCM 21142]
MENKIKIALVTGGSRGLGKNMALELAKKGIHIVLTYNSNEEKAKEVIESIERIGQQAIMVKLNVADFQSSKSSLVLLKS